MCEKVTKHTGTHTHIHTFNDPPGRIQLCIRISFSTSSFPYIKFKPTNIKLHLHRTYGITTRNIETNRNKKGN